MSDENPIQTPAEEVTPEEVIAEEAAEVEEELAADEAAVVEEV